MNYGICIKAQIKDSLNQDTGPKIGLTQLALKYYGIDFTKEQRKIIDGVEIELIYAVDESGIPILNDINGISDTFIIDSLKKITPKIGLFKQLHNQGVAMPYIYFVKLTFPEYKLTNIDYQLLNVGIFNALKIEDFEYIQESDQGFDMIFSVLINQFVGIPSEYLGIGGGFKTDLSYSFKKKYNCGLNLSMYAGKLKKNFPLNTTRKQLDGPPTLLLGLHFGRWFDKYKLQAEVSYGIQNLTKRIETNDLDWIQLKGWSSGIVLNYPIQLGKKKPMLFYGSPSLLINNINLHIGFRYIRLSLKEASGLVAEFGIGYRMTMRGIKDFKLKEKI
jgi:hypothetical protein